MAFGLLPFFFAEVMKVMVAAAAARGHCDEHYKLRRKRQTA